MEVDFDVALAPDLSNADRLGGGSAQVGDVLCKSSPGPPTQFSLPLAASAGELVSVPKKQLRRHAAAGETILDEIYASWARRGSSGRRPKTSAAWTG